MPPERKPTELYLPKSPMKPTEISPRNISRNIDLWFAEKKFDGIRTLILLSPSMGVIITTVNSRNITPHFRMIARELEPVASTHIAVLDGELVHTEGKNASDRNLVVHRSTGSRQAPEEEFTFQAFDILNLDGEDLTKRHIEDRKRKLSELITPTEHVKLVQPYTYEELIVELEKMEGDTYDEGIVLKKLGTNYTSGLSSNWRKVKYN
ncbi:MAG: hypothetical protein NUV69_05510 [Candidatus Curtissbacteria bacterium]|nr:hypothetical protein [Candidatus Curtissbacteria bacterium]